MHYLFNCEHFTLHETIVLAISI